MTVKKINFQIDEEDRELISKFSWCANSGGLRARVRGTDDKIYMHRLIMNPSEEQFVDHIDGDRTNNRRSNLRICSRMDNAKNRKTNIGRKYKGVKRCPNGKFQARIVYNRKQIHIGTYDTEERAYNEYCKKATELFGEFVRGGS